MSKSLRFFRDWNRISVLLALTLLILLTVYRHIHADIPVGFLERDSRKLVNMGLRTHSADSALACFGVVASRYEESASDSQKELCVKALINMAYLQAGSLFDYKSAISNLLKASDISQTIKNTPDLALVYLNLGSIYTVYGILGEMPSWQQEADSNYQRGFRTAMRLHQWDIALKCLYNYSCTSFTVAHIDTSLSMMDSINNAHVPASTEFYSQTINLVKSLQYLKSEEYDKAIRRMCQYSQDALLPKPVASRFETRTLANAAEIYRMAGEPDSVVTYLRRIENIAQATSQYDMLAYAYRELSRIWSTTHLDSLSHAYNSRYLSLKDSLMTKAHLQAVSELKFTHEIDSYLLQLEERETEKASLYWILALSIAIAGLLAGILLMFRRKNKRLYTQWQELYRQYKQQSVLPAINTNVKTQAQSPSKSTGVPSDDKTSKNPALKDYTEELRQISLFMQTSETIYDTEFTQTSMAKAMNMKPWVLSAAINSTGRNFNTLLNEYRVKEACRRLDDREHYGTLTIEAISRSVGFRSRMSLLSAFKKFTGLTPSQYLKASKECNKNADKHTTKG